VEHNDQELKILDILKSLFYVGLPVYFTFFLQIYIVYELYLFLETTDATKSYCKGDDMLLWVINAVFLIYIGPAVKSIFNETNVLFRSVQVAFTQEIDDDIVTLHKLLAPPSKRFFVWMAVVFPEILVLTFVFITGIAYM
jgi:hypothetical protein